MENNKHKTRNIFLTIVGCIFLYWFLMYNERFWQYYDIVVSIFSPFIVGAVVAFILNVPMRAFERWFKFIKKDATRRAVAITLTILSVLMVLAIILPMLIVQLVETFQDLAPKLEKFLTVDMPALINGLMEDNPDIKDFINANFNLQSFDWSSLASNLISVVGTSLSAVLQGVLGAIGSTISGLFNGVIAAVFAIYCLFQKETLARQSRKILYAFLPEKSADYIVRIMRMSNVTFSNFLSGQCIEVVILGLMFALTMVIFGMPHIPLISVVVAITAFIPVVGAWVGCVIGAFLILVTSPIQALWFVVLFIVLQQIENNLIYPRVVGTSIGLSGMWVLVAVSVGGSVMGVAGMFLMIPVTSVIYAVVREWTDNRLKKREVTPEKLQPHPMEHKVERHKKSDPITVNDEMFDDVAWFDQQENGSAESDR